MEDHKPQPDEQNVQTPAQTLGLENGQFVVERTPAEGEEHGTQETGWDVFSTFEGPTKEGGTDSYTTIVKYDDEAKGILRKTIPTSRLMGWQATEAEDNDVTVPRSQLQKLVEKPTEGADGSSEPNDVETAASDEIIDPAIIDEAGDLAVEQVVEEPTLEVERLKQPEPEMNISLEDLTKVQMIINDVMGTLQRYPNPEQSGRATEAAVGFLYSYAEQADAQSGAQKALRLFAAGLEISTQPDFTHAFNIIQSNKTAGPSYERTIIEQLGETAKHLNQVAAEQGRQAIIGRASHDIETMLMNIEQGNEKYVPNKKELEMIVCGAAIGLSPHPSMAQEVITRLEHKFTIK